MNRSKAMRRLLTSCITAAVAVAVCVLLGTGLVPAATNLGQCISDAANFDQGNICTAEDVRVGQFNVIGAAPATCVVGETMTLTLQAVTICGSQSRYDVGFYVAQDGGDAKKPGSVCFRDYLNPVSANNLDQDLNCALDNAGDGADNCGPYYNAETNRSDTCGDIQQNLSNLFTLNDGAPITFTCTDRNGDGNADIGACVSWDNQSNSGCSNELTTIPGTPSKCKCGPVPINPGIVVKGRIFVDKVTIPNPDRTNTSFSFTLTGGSVSQSFGLTNADVPHDSGPLDIPLTYQVAEQTQPGWSQTSSTCVGDNRTPEDSSDDRTLPPGAIDLRSGEVVRCTITNTKDIDRCEGVVCAPLDQCHVAGVCNPATGVCSNPAADDGTACNDGTACTQTDTCQSGSCTGSNPVVCTALDQCHVVGACNPATGVCSNPAASNGTTCNDGNACTRTDTCQSGSCTGGNAVVCTALDQCHVAGVCDTSTGDCSNPEVPNGTTCSDGNGCTQTDTCQSGSCTGSNPVVCTALDQCHVAGVCDTSTGVCSNPTKPNGTSCSDGNACTTSDTCQSGSCSSGNPVVCTALDQCHVAGVCNTSTGVCSNPAAPNGTSCNDGNLCSQTDTCQSGTCTGSNPVVCTALDQCHVAGACNPGTGVCSNPAASNGTTCSDGNACTVRDTCQSGSCTSGSPVVCRASDSCHVAGVCDTSTGLCSNPTAPDGTTCSDGNACSGGDTCSAGSCVGGAPIDCRDIDDCTADSCNPLTGCEHRDMCSSAQITHTNITCAVFADRMAPKLSEILYGVKSSKISNVAPGVYFYYTRITAPSSSFTVTIGQSHAPIPNPDWRQLGIQQVQVYDANCAKQVQNNVTVGSDGKVTVAISHAVSGAEYFISVKYSPGVLNGTLVSWQGGAYPSVSYTDGTSLNGALIYSSVKSILVRSKDGISTPGGGLPTFPIAP